MKYNVYLPNIVLLFGLFCWKCIILNECDFWHPLFMTPMTLNGREAHFLFRIKQWETTPPNWGESYVTRMKHLNFFVFDQNYYIFRCMLFVCTHNKISMDPQGGVSIFL